MQIQITQLSTPYGVDPDGPFPSDRDYQISIPESSIQLSDVPQQFLNTQFNHHTDEGGNGKNEYGRCVEILQMLLQE